MGIIYCSVVYLSTLFVQFIPPPFPWPCPPLSPVQVAGRLQSSFTVVLRPSRANFRILKFYFFQYKYIQTLCDHLNLNFKHPVHDAVKLQARCRPSGNLTICVKSNQCKTKMWDKIFQSVHFLFKATTKTSKQAHWKNF